MSARRSASDCITSEGCNICAAAALAATYFLVVSDPPELEGIPAGVVAGSGLLSVPLGADKAGGLESVLMVGHCEPECVLVLLAWL